MRAVLLPAAAAAYVAALVFLTLVAAPQPGPSPNLVPLRTIAGCCAIGGRTMVVNVAGNLALLAPMGFLLPAAWPGRFGPWRVLIAGFAASVAIESTQYACGHRMADVDDVILNAIGAPMGLAARRGLSAAARAGACIARSASAFAGPGRPLPGWGRATR